MVKIVKEYKIKPIIDRVFPLEEGKNGYKKLEEGKHFGKIVLSL